MWKLVVFRTTLALGLLALDMDPLTLTNLVFLAFLMGMKIYNSCGNRVIYLAPSSRQDFGKAEAVLILGFLAMNTALLFS